MNELFCTVRHRNFTEIKVTLEIVGMKRLNVLRGTECFYRKMWYYIIGLPNRLFSIATKRTLTKALTYYYINRSQRHLFSAIENN